MIDEAANPGDQAAPPREEPGIDGGQPAQDGAGVDDWGEQVPVLDEAQVADEGAGQNQAQGEAEEANWNPMEWDRPAEELTWERLLGFDGSLLFLEHVFWVISLNTVFIMVNNDNYNNNNNGKAFNSV